MQKKKIAMLGMWGVGKTSLVRRFVQSLFDERYLSTLGVKVDKKQLEVGGEELTMMLWDIAGAEDSFNIPMHYIKGSAGYLLVIDGTRRESLEAAIDLVHYVKQGLGELPFIPVVNKSDLEWQVSTEEIEAALAPFGQPWFTTSAKTGAQVEEAFQALAQRVL